jgi:uncharacterized membrane protein
MSMDVNHDIAIEKHAPKNPTHSKHVANILQYQSPFPPPEVLAKYEQLHPGMVKKIMEMSEIQSEHRRNIEIKLSEAQIRHQKCTDIEAFIGQACAFTIVMTSLIGGIYLIISGYQGAGTFFSAMSLILVGVVGFFIKGRNRETAKKPA